MIIANKAMRDRNDLAGANAVQELKKRRFEAYYVNTGAEAVEKALSLIPKTDVVAWGGSMTLAEIGMKEKLIASGYTLIDRDRAKTKEERTEIMRKAQLCDTFLMSSNAITEDGQLFNIDGNGNRLGAFIYGPKSVVMIVGINKLVKTLEDAISRVRNFTAPVNQMRFNGKTPCSKTGECADCLSDDCICAQMVITRFCKPAGRIKIILVGEVLGF